MEIVNHLRKLFESEEFQLEIRRGKRMVSNVFNREELRRNPQSIFQSILAKKTSEKLKDYQVFLSIALRMPSDKKVRKVLQSKREIIKEYLCGETYGDSNPCKYRDDCLEGVSKDTEVDALIVGNEELCIVEYEDDVDGLCQCLTHASRILAYEDKPRFSLVFVTPIRSKEGQKKFDDYVEGARVLFKGLINEKDWAIVAIRRLRDE